MDELQSYISQPNKTFMDYRNQYLLYKVGAKALQLQIREVKAVIGIIDYGSGNINAIVNVHEQLNVSYTVVKQNQIY